MGLSEIESEKEKSKSNRRKLMALMKENEVLKRQVEIFTRELQLASIVEKDKTFTIEQRILENLRKKDPSTSNFLWF